MVARARTDGVEDGLGPEVPKVAHCVGKPARLNYRLWVRSAGSKPPLERRLGLLPHVPGLARLADVPGLAWLADVPDSGRLAHPPDSGRLAHRPDSGQLAHAPGTAA